MAVFHARSGSTGGLTGGIERQVVLEAFDEIGQDQACHAEEQHGDGVTLPILLFLLLDPADPIDGPLHRMQDSLEPGVLFLEDGHQIPAHRDADQHQQITK